MKDWVDLINTYGMETFKEILTQYNNYWCDAFFDGDWLEYSDYADMLYYEIMEAYRG